MKFSLRSKSVLSVASLALSTMSVLILMQNCSEPLPVDEAQTSSSVTPTPQAIIGQVASAPKTCLLNGVTYQAGQITESIPVAGPSGTYTESQACTFEGAIVRTYQRFYKHICNGNTGSFDELEIVSRFVSSNDSSCRSSARSCGSVAHTAIIEQSDKRLVDLTCNRLIWAPSDAIYSETETVENSFVKNLIRTRSSYGSYKTNFQCNDGTLTQLIDTRSIDERFVPDSGQHRCSAPTECFPSRVTKQITATNGQTETLSAWVGKYGIAGQTYGQAYGANTGSIDIVNGTPVVYGNFVIYDYNARCEIVNGLAKWEIISYSPSNFNFGLDFNFTCSNIDPFGTARYECN